MTPPPSVIWTAYGPPAFAALRDVVERAKGDDRLRPVTVVVPTNAIGVAARRHLAAQPHGVVALTVLTPYRLAELLGAARLAAAGRRPVATPILLAALRREVRREPGVLAPVASHPATEEALVAAYRELSDLDGPALARLARASARAGDVVRLVGAARRRLGAGWYDEADLLDAAVAELAADPRRAGELGHVVVHLPQDTSRRAARLAAAVAERNPTTVIAALAGPAEADRGVLRGLHRMGIDTAPSSSATSGPTGPTTPAVAQVVTASDADDEVRAAVAMVLDAARAGTPLARIAVVHTNDQPYQRLVTEHLGAAGLPWTGRDPRPVAHHAAGRFARALLALPDRRYQRADVHALLALAPVRDRDGRRVPAAAWERHSRGAGVVSGRAEWDRRLATAAAALRSHPEGHDDSDPAAGSARRRREAEQIERLRSFVLDLVDRLERLRLASSWASFGRDAESLLVRLLGPDDERDEWPASEQRAAEAVSTALDRLGRLDRVDPDPDFERFRRALELELDTDLGRHGRLGEDIVVGSLAAAVGLELDLVIVLGAVEGWLPAPPTRDPLLPDDERALAVDLTLAADGPGRQHRQLIAALAAGRHVIVTRPRGDLRHAGGYQPSRWLTDLVDPGAVEHERPSFAGALATTSFPSTEQELHLHELLGGRTAALAGDVAFERARALVHARASDALTAYDGDVSATSRARRRVGDRPLSPTRLEAWAKCPFHYFVQHVLGAEAVERPEAALSMTAIDTGNLVHQVLERLVVDALTLVPTPMDWCEPHHLQRLGAILQDAFADAEARGLTGKPVFWRHDRAVLQTSLLNFVVADRNRMQVSGAVPVAGELRFGWPGTPEVHIDLPDGRRLAFRGAIDRVDRTADGRLLVTDYKSGHRTRYTDITAENPHASGLRYQLPVYAMAVRAAYGDGPVEAHYRFISDPDKPIGFTVDDDITTEVARAMAIVVDGIEGGLFPARPPDTSFSTWVGCPSCDPDGLGVGELHHAWTRKRRDARLAAYLALVGEDAEGTEGGDDA